MFRKTGSLLHKVPDSRKCLLNHNVNSNRAGRNSCHKELNLREIIILRDLNPEISGHRSVVKHTPRNSLANLKGLNIVRLSSNASKEWQPGHSNVLKCSKDGKGYLILRMTGEKWKGADKSKIYSLLVKTFLSVKTLLCTDC